MRKGFTLVELLVIIAIIGIVAALIIAAVGGLPSSENQAGFTSPTTERLEIVDGPLEIGNSDIYVLRDKQTEIEFVYATDNYDFGSLMPLRGSDER